MFPQNKVFSKISAYINTQNIIFFKKLIFLFSKSFKFPLVYFQVPNKKINS